MAPFFRILFDCASFEQVVNSFDYALPWPGLANCHCQEENYSALKFIFA